MGLSIKTEGLKLVDDWLARFKDAPLSKKQVKEVARLFVATLSADSRWVRIERKDVAKYTEGTHPKGDFLPLEFSRKEQGKTVKHKVMCDKGVYFVELVSKNGVVKGWHADLMRQIKDSEIKLPTEASSVLFDMGQTIINDKERQYRE